MGRDYSIPMGEGRFKRSPVSPIILVVSVVAYLVMAPIGISMFGFGELPDGDDYMRLQEVKDFIGGQSWADTDQHRLVTEERGSMHFSRLPDIPMTALVLMARPFLGDANAEIFMLYAYPLLILIGFLAAMDATVRTFNPKATFYLVAFLAAIPNVFLQFIPTRIDHQNLQMLLAICALLCSVRALERPKWAYGAALAVVSTLAIGMETAPIVLATAIAISIPFLANGDPRALKNFSVALLAASPLALLVVTAGSAPVIFHCDAYSLIQMTGGALGGAVGLGLIAFAGRVKLAAGRLAIAAVLGSVAAGAMALLFPGCLAGPFGPLDTPLLAEWDAGLRASQGFSYYIQQNPILAVLHYGPSLVGLAAAIYLLRQSRGIDAQRWMVVLVFLALSAAVSLWMIRAGLFALPIAVIPPVILVSKASGALKNAPPRAYLKYLALVAGVSPVSTLVFASQISAIQAAGPSPEKTIIGGLCGSRNSGYDQLDRFPEGLILTQIDVAPYVLVHSRHRITSAGYHRNRSGIELSMSVFTGAPDDAAKRAIGSGADYLFFCPISTAANRYESMHPDSLAAHLRRDETPDWLEPLDIGRSAGKFYRINKDAG